MRGKRKSTPLLVDTDEEFEAVERNPREKLTQVCEALDIDTDLLRFPSNGFTIESLEKNTGIKRAKRIVRTIVKGVCDQVCPYNSRLLLGPILMNWIQGLISC